MGVFILALVTFPADHILLTGALTRDLVTVDGGGAILVAVTWVATVASNWSIIVILTVACPISFVTRGVETQIIGTVTGATHGETVPSILTGLSGDLFTVLSTL